MGPVRSFRYKVTWGAKRRNEKRLLYNAIESGDTDSVKRILESNESVKSSVNKGLVLPKITPLQFAAFLGKVDVLIALLEMGVEANARNVNGQTPLMFACKGGNEQCVEQLLCHRADALAFDRITGRTCLHIACRLGHYGCVSKILEAVQNGPISTTWGFTRFVNVRDNNGAMPLHMAARAGHVEIVRLLLNRGALISAVTCSSTYGPGHGSSPLHCAAKNGSLMCVEELLAWGADRTQKDLMGNTPHMIAAHRGNLVCASILDPTAAEPMVWPSPLKFIQELEPETRSLLQDALAQANRVRYSVALPRKETRLSLVSVIFCFGKFKKAGLYEVCGEDCLQQSPSLSQEDSGCYTCCICFESCHKMIEVDVCGHQMCAACTIALCCLNKPKSPTTISRAPSCPFCRRDIENLRLAKAPSGNCGNLISNAPKCVISSNSWRKNSSRRDKIFLSSSFHHI